MLVSSLLGIASAVCWGTADFLGGYQSRRLPAMTVALFGQLTGCVLLTLLVLILQVPWTAEALVTGAAAGVCGGIALSLFYRGLASGVMSLVAPIAACGAAVPVCLAAVLGHLPSPLALGGIVVALLGILLVSLTPGSVPQSQQSARTAIFLALGSALGFGLFYVFVDLGAREMHAPPLWIIVAARFAGLVAVALLALRANLRPTCPPSQLPGVILVGVLDTTANVLFAFASTNGNPAVVAVLASLYPVSTLVLARLVLRERLTRPQGAGVVLALSGVALMSVP